MTLKNSTSNFQLFQTVKKVILLLTMYFFNKGKRVLKEKKKIKISNTERCRSDYPLLEEPQE